MLLHSVQTFMARHDVACVVVVLPRQYAGDPPPWLFQCDVDRLLVAQGGRERAESVANGLEDLPAEAEIVLVHDAARAFMPSQVIASVAAAVGAGDVRLVAFGVGGRPVRLTRSEGAARSGRGAESRRAAAAAARPVVGNRSLMIFHLPDCAWADKIPARRREDFISPDAARSAGFRPCRVCAP
jgi:2-C-methyl-D-erythritol 4-phosphate cytidylyltransferase